MEEIKYNSTSYTEGIQDVIYIMAYVSNGIIKVSNFGAEAASAKRPVLLGDLHLYFYGVSSSRSPLACIILVRTCLPGHAIFIALGYKMWQTSQVN